MSRIDAGLRLVWAGDPQQPIMQADFNAGSLDGKVNGYLECIEV